MNVHIDECLLFCRMLSPYSACCFWHISSGVEDETLLVCNMAGLQVRNEMSRVNMKVSITQSLNRSLTLVDSECGRD